MRAHFSIKFPAESTAAAVILTAFLLTSGCAKLIPPAAGIVINPWGAYLHDEGRVNRTPESIAPPLNLAWKSSISPLRLINKFPKEQSSSPLISSGALYAGSENGKFYAFDLKKGSLLWKFKAGAPIEGSAAVSEGAVCFGTSAGVFRCLEAADGRERWSFQAKSEIVSSPLIKNGRVYISSSDDRVYAFDLKTGEKLWSYSRASFQTVSARVFGSPAYFDGKLFQLFSDGRITAISADSGREMWSKPVVESFDAADKIRRTPLVENGIVYIIDGNGAVEAFNTADGSVRGIYNIIKAKDFIVQGRRLIAAGGDKIVALDTASGAILWQKALAHGPPSSVFAAGERLFVFSNYTHKRLGVNFLSKDYGRLQAVGLAAGDGLWDMTLPSTVGANGSASENMVAVFLNSGKLMVFNGAGSSDVSKR